MRQRCTARSAAVFVLLALPPLRWVRKRLVGQETSGEERLAADKAELRGFGVAADAKAAI
jgi:hypothetical protein